ncbi:DUF4236 domain-containing protein [Streptomyces sp. NPDC001795]|uniref:DUF4236 domain-containing protein n=1 Tax=Streptomyces sp. NPDC001795 TaxID=3154525 RepID=UPI00332C153B
MDFSHRKSFKAGPFRVAASKAGVSYSAGVKGARIMKRADGRVLATLSAPGTGLRNTTSSSGTKRASSPAPAALALPSNADLKAAYEAFYIQALDQLRAGHSGAELRGFLHNEGIATPQLLQAIADAEQQSPEKSAGRERPSCEPSKRPHSKLSPAQRQGVAPTPRHPAEAVGARSPSPSPGRRAAPRPARPAWFNSVWPVPRFFLGAVFSYLRDFITEKRRMDRPRERRVREYGAVQLDGVQAATARAGSRSRTATMHCRDKVHEWGRRDPRRSPRAPQ